MGGPEFFSRGKGAGDWNFVLRLRGGPEKIENRPSHIDAAPLLVKKIKTPLPIYKNVHKVDVFSTMTSTLQFYIFIIIGLNIVTSQRIQSFKKAIDTGLCGNILETVTGTDLQCLTRYFEPPLGAIREQGEFPLRPMGAGLWPKIRKGAGSTKNCKKEKGATKKLSGRKSKKENGAGRKMKLKRCNEKW